MHAYAFGKNSTVANVGQVSPARGGAHDLTERLILIQ
jgi:hypothetical protein